jgi:hypothetical protein
MTDSAAPHRSPFADIAPALADYTDNVLFGDVWKRPGLSARDRSLVTVASLVVPHVIVKLWPGKSKAQKERLAQKIAQDASPWSRTSITSSNTRRRRCLRLASRRRTQDG